MSKYKICPSCGTHNPPTLFECLECEADLTAVKATDSETEQIPEKITAPPNLFRICECGAKNHPSARKCSECGEDISDIIPSADTGENIHFILSSSDGKYAFEVTGNTVIGREKAMSEYLRDKSYVSRNHAELTISNGKLFIKNLSAANGTYINNEKADDNSHELKNGDEISLGGCTVNGSQQEKAAYFTVRISSCM